jgi:hypothetical protein
MEGRHIYTGTQKHGLFILAIGSAGPDVLGGGGNDVDEKTLVFLVVVSKKTADRIDLFVLILQQRAQVGFTAAPFGGIVHI